VHFGCVQRQHKIPVGATWGHRVHNFLAVGAIAPMELAPMAEAMLAEPTITFCCCRLDPFFLFSRLIGRSVDRRPTLHKMFVDDPEL